MTEALYRLKKAEPGSGVPGSHELKSGKVVSHTQAQTFDPSKEGLADYVEAVSVPAKPAPAKPPA